MMKAAKAANPDAFVAWSYPPDTFGLAEQAKIEGLNVKAYYSAVAVAFPAFLGKFGASARTFSARAAFRTCRRSATSTSGTRK